MSALDDLVAAHLGVTFPALAVMAVRDGKVVVHRHWGCIDPETGRGRIDETTLFDLASLSKLFTATAYLSLVSEGRVGLDDPLVSIIPEFGGGERPMDGGVDPHSKQALPMLDSSRGRMADPRRVTFRHLLAHTSGLAPWRAVYAEAGPPPAQPDEPEPVPRDVRWAGALAALVRYPFVARPGERVRYSDLGFMLLGEAAARLQNAPFEEVVRKRVIAPLGLSSLIWNPVRAGIPRDRIVPTEFDADWRRRRAWGEVHDENCCGVGGIAGHAGLFGTVEDVARFGQAWLAGDARLGLAADIWHDAMSEQAVGEDGTRRGLGWLMLSPDSSAGDRFSRDSIGHTGFTGTSLWIDPQRRLVVACLTNRVYRGRKPEGIHPFRRALHDAMVETSDPVIA